MVNSTHCLYCNLPATSEEHLISEALGCGETIDLAVCISCNRKFGHGFEGKFLNGLALFRNFFKIPNGRGRIPPVKMRGFMGGKLFSFSITGDGKVEASPTPLRAEVSATAFGKTFRVLRKGHETKIEAALRSHHPDLAWQQVRDIQTKQVIDAEAEFDVGDLGSVNANRTVAKYALNLLVNANGYKWVSERCQDLVHFVLGQSSHARVGIFWEPSVLKWFPFEPPKHMFVAACNSRSRTVIVFLYLFSLLPYCVVSEVAPSAIDTMWSGVLDPHEGRLGPLILGSSSALLRLRGAPPFPAPEFTFCEGLRHLS